MDRHKYSAAADPDVVRFLVDNAIPFVYRKGFQSQRYRVFFVATEEDAETLADLTGWHASDEDDGWDFDGWEVIERK